MNKTWAIGEARFKSNADWYEHELSYILLNTKMSSIKSWRFCKFNNLVGMQIWYNTTNVAFDKLPIAKMIIFRHRKNNECLKNFPWNRRRNTFTGIVHNFSSNIFQWKLCTFHFCNKFLTFHMAHKYWEDHFKWNNSLFTCSHWFLIIEVLKNL